MEIISNCLGKIVSSFSNLSVYHKKLLIYSAISTSAGYLFYHFFLKKKKDDPPKKNIKTPDGKELNFTQTQIDFMRRKMRLEGINLLRTNKSKLNMNTKKGFKINKTIKKIESQRGNVIKSDHIFYTILNKFSSFVLRNKFAFAFA